MNPTGKRQVASQSNGLISATVKSLPSVYNSLVYEVDCVVSIGLALCFHLVPITWRPEEHMLHISWRLNPALLVKAVNSNAG